MRSQQAAEWFKGQVSYFSGLNFIICMDYGFLIIVQHYYCTCFQGFQKLYNIVGGIDAYSQKVDSSIPRY